MVTGVMEKLIERLEDSEKHEYGSIVGIVGRSNSRPVGPMGQGSNREPDGHSFVRSDEGKAALALEKRTGANEQEHVSTTAAQNSPHDKSFEEL